MSSEKNPVWDVTKMHGGYSEVYGNCIRMLLKTSTINIQIVSECWYIVIDTLSTLGSLFSSIPPYCVGRDSGT
jgi:hypothetical protein